MKSTAENEEVLGHAVGEVADAYHKLEGRREDVRNGMARVHELMLTNKPGQAKLDGLAEYKLKMAQSAKRQGVEEMDVEK